MHRHRREPDQRPEHVGRHRAAGDSGHAAGHSRRPHGLRALERLIGLVEQADDQEILDAKAIVGRGGIGCEPASAASVAGTKKLVESGVIGRGERVVCIITGHQLKAPNTTVDYHSLQGAELQKGFQDYGIRSNQFANRPIQVPNELSAILKALES